MKSQVLLLIAYFHNCSLILSMITRIPVHEEPPLSREFENIAAVVISIIKHQNIHKFIYIANGKTVDKVGYDICFWDKLLWTLSRSNTSCTYEMKYSHEFLKLMRLHNQSDNNKQGDNRYWTNMRNLFMGMNWDILDHKPTFVYIPVTLNTVLLSHLQMLHVNVILIINRDILREYKKYLTVGSKVIIIASTHDFICFSTDCCKYNHLNKREHSFNDSIINLSNIGSEHPLDDSPIEPTCYEIFILSLETEQLHRVGYWNNTAGLQITVNDFWRVNQFRNKSFRVVTTPIPTFHYKDQYGRWTGVCIELLDKLSVKLNFTYHLVEPPDGKWGALDQNGTWNGMIGMVHRNEVDFGLGKFTISPERESVVDFTIPFFHEPVAMMMKKQYGSTSPVYVSPFRYEVWTCLLLTIFGLTFVLLMFTYLKLCNTALKMNLKDILHPFNIGQTLFVVIASLFTQGMVGQSLYSRSRERNRKEINRLIWKSGAIRLVLSSWFVFGVIFFATYTGNLTSFLAVQKLYKPINTLQELLSQSNYKLGVLDSGAINLATMSSESIVFKGMWNHSVRYKENRAETLDIGAEMTKHRKYIFFIEKSWAVDYVSKDCGVTLGDKFIFDSLYGFAFQEHSPYVKDFNRILLRLIDQGWVTYLYDKHKAKDMCKTADIRVSHKPITVDKIQRALLVLAGVLLFNTAVLIAENVLHYITSRL